ncbi:hypothetical protein BH11ARM2_BH11ARM2_17720 [soil metagenome]
MGSLTFKFLAGLGAGLAAWAIIEPTNPGLAGNWGAFELRLIIALGLLVGGAVGALNGFAQGSKLHVLRGLLMGGLFGMIGASFGYGLGGGIAHAIFGSVGQGVAAILSRVVALTPLGACLGLAIGGSSLSGRRAVQGLIGGAIGAAIGAGLFDAVGALFATTQLALNGVGNGGTGEVGSIPRAIFAASMGGGIGLFIGLVDLLARSAWVRLELGRNEGKEWSLDHAQNFIGRSESAQIPLFGDPNVAPMHACIQKVGKNQYAIQDGGSPIGTYVNGQRIQQCMLAQGSVIQIAGFRLVFLMKEGRGGARVSDGRYAAPQNPYAAPQPGYAPQAGPATTSYGTPPGPVSNQTVAYPGQAALNQTVAYPQQAAGPTLVVLDGPLAGQRFPIAGPIVLGRECPNLQMGYDTMASRRHAEITPMPGGAMVTDLGSTNGTFVNGTRVPDAPLRPGDVLKVGATSFRIV